MTEPAEVVLQDDPHRRVVRVGDTVRRPRLPWSPAVHALLEHLAAVGFRYAPRVLGVDAQDREVLSWQQGASGAAGWARVADEHGLAAMARLLREYHDAVAGFRPAGLTWAGRDEPQGPDEIVCHGDFGPWNLVWHDLDPVGVLDWDYAWPAAPVYDVAYALEYVTPFRADEECVRRLAYERPPDRRHRLETFATAYGLTSTAGLVDAVVAQQRQVRNRVRALGAAGHEPQATWLAAGSGEQVQARIRWSEEHRHLFG